jgi:hypothetical protein
MRCVNGETLERTKSCPREFVCLENGGRPRCPAVCATCEGVKLGNGGYAGCPYCVERGTGRVCMCPTRAELLEKHGV